MGRFIYLDNAATTKTSPAVVEAMLPYFTQEYGNASSIYGFGGNNKAALREARQALAGAIGAKEEEIFFTSGGTEADNWAIKGVMGAAGSGKNHVITSKIEHHAVLHTCEYLEKQGVEVTYLDVDEYGMVRPEEVQRAIRPETALISIMFANNEIGTVEPIREIGRIASREKVFFHTDAVQAFGHLPIHVNECHIDLLSASGHKINGPKGVGFLYVRKGVKIHPLLHGGAQERKRRAGTENIPAIVGLKEAALQAVKTMEERIRKEKELRDYLIDRVLQEVPYSRLNGHRKIRLPNNANFCFRFIEGESLLIMLDMEGVCASSGSACTSGSLDPSHVLLAIGLPHEIAHGSLRLTLSAETTKEEIDYTVDKIKAIVKRLRDMSPLYEDFIKSGGADSDPAM